MKIALVFLFLLCSPYFGAAQNESLSTAIDGLFETVADDAPGYQVAVIKDGAFLFEQGYGLANLEHNISISSQTNFNIASLSKQFTAAAIALLILDGKISLEDPVSTYLPDFPFAADDVRIKHLIYMTSGINDYYYNDRSNGSDWSSLNFFNVDTAIQASYGSGELMYAPGSQWSYSNINYMLLTRIVEKVSGKRFSEFAQEQIFTPLGMGNTFVNDDIFQVIPNRALGYNFRDDENTNWLLESNYLQDRGEGFLQIHRNSPHYGGSGIYTSMEDFRKWIANFADKKFGGEEFYELMHSTMKFEHDKANDAFGLVLSEKDGKDIVWYEGGDWGYSAYMLRFPASEITLVCFSNLGTGNARGKALQIYEVLQSQGIIK